MSREITLTRFFDAAPALVFELWTRPEHLKHWFGPSCFTPPKPRSIFGSAGAIAS